MSLKTKNNSFLMHENGEDDLRGVYIVIVVASLLNILTSDLIDGVADYISSC
jgi:protein farnesyltransferase subunit beta